MNNCEPIKGLLVGLLDGELTPDETRQINAHLTRCAACRAEFEQLREASGKLAAISFQEPSDVVLAQIWESPFSRLARNTSLGLIIGGYAGLMGYGRFEFLTSGTKELPAKMGLAAIIVGFLILLFQLIRKRVKTYKTDPYKEIERCSSRLPNPSKARKSSAPLGWRRATRFARVTLDGTSWR